MEGGVLTVAVLFILPFLLGVFPEFSADFRTRPPLEQNLTRAANGFALMVLLLVGLYRFGGGPSVAFANLDDFTARPAAHWMPITGVVLFFYGLFRFIQGVCSCWGCRDGALTNRAFFTTALSLVAVCFLWTRQGRQLLSNGWLVVVWLVLLITCAWLALTGFVRFVLLTVGGSNALGKLHAMVNGNYAAMGPTSARDWAEAFKWAWENGLSGSKEKAQTFAQHVAQIALGLATLAAIVLLGCLISWGQSAWSNIFPPTAKAATAEVSATSGPPPRTHHAPHHHVTE
jgi:hypothetical protein